MVIEISFKKLRKSRKARLVLVMFILLLLTSAVLILKPFSPNPLPDNLRSKVKFSVAYPNGRGISVDQSSWAYSDEQKSVSYNIKGADFTAVVTEQKLPLQFRDDPAAYNRFIGTLRPTLNFDSPLGTVSVANFVSGFGTEFQPEGPSGILSTHGTLIIAHPNRLKLSDDDWQNLFDSLQVN